MTLTSKKKALVTLSLILLFLGVTLAISVIVASAAKFIIPTLNYTVSISVVWLSITIWMVYLLRTAKREQLGEIT